MRLGLLTVPVGQLRWRAPLLPHGDLDRFPLAGGDQPRMQAGALAAQLTEALFQPGDALGLLVGVEGLRSARKAVDRDLEVSEIGAVLANDRDTEGSELGGEFVPQLPQRPVGVGRDEHPLALGQQMREDVGQRVGLAGSRRTLHHRVVRAVHAGHDAALLLVGLQRKEHLTVARRGRLPFGLDGGRSLVGHLDELGETGRHVTGLFEVVDDSVEDAQQVPGPAATQDEGGAEGDLGNPARGGLLQLLARLGVGVKRVRDAGQQLPGALRIERVMIEVLDASREFLASLARWPPLSVEHLEVELRAARVLVGLYTQGSVGFVERDLRRQGDHVALYLWMAVGVPGEQADREHELELLGRALCPLGDAKHPLVHLAQRFAAPLFLAPTPPRRQPLIERSLHLGVLVQPFDRGDLDRLVGRRLTLSGFAVAFSPQSRGLVPLTLVHDPPVQQFGKLGSWATGDAFGHQPWVVTFGRAAVRDGQLWLDGEFMEPQHVTVAAVLARASNNRRALALHKTQVLKQPDRLLERWFASRWA